MTRHKKEPVVVQSTPVDPLKHRTRCDTFKDRGLFHNWKLGKDGKQTWCQSCVKEYSDDNRERINENSRNYRAQHRELVRIKDAQITSIQKTLRAYGGD